MKRLIRWSLGLPIQVEQADFDTATQKELAPDLTVLDFGNLTLMRAQGQYRAGLGRVFAQAPAAVVCTDIEGTRFPLHRKDYAKRLKVASLSFEEYLQAVAGWFQSEFGYGMGDCFHAGRAGSLRPETAVFILKPGPGDLRVHPW